MSDYRMITERTGAGGCEDSSVKINQKQQEERLWL